MKSYDHLFFDLDHTLWDFPGNSRLALNLMFKAFKLEQHIHSFEAFHSVYEDINIGLWADYRDKKIDKDTLIEKRFSQSLAHFGVSGFNAQEQNACYLDFMAQQTLLYPGTVETLTYLRQRTYQMHIITNGFKEVQRLKMRNSGLEPFFGKVFISEEVQANKPEREIFEYAVKSVNARKTRSLMIGDNWEADILGAMNFGIDQVMFRNHGENPLPEEISNIADQQTPQQPLLQKRNKTFFIHELSELRQIL